MTLKEFLNENLISATPNQRAKLGTLLQSQNYIKKLEDGYPVRDYSLSYLMQEETIDIILTFFKNEEFDKLSNTF